MSKELVESLITTIGKDPDLKARLTAALSSPHAPVNGRFEALLQEIRDLRVDLKAALDAALPRCVKGLLLPEHLPVCPIENVVRDETLRAVKACGGNKREAARLLGISPGRIYAILGEGKALSTLEQALARSQAARASAHEARECRKAVRLIVFAFFCDMDKVVEDHGLFTRSPRRKKQDETKKEG